jgi:GntR family transcriptional regulator, carbon starvation induced regulator
MQAFPLQPDRPAEREFLPSRPPCIVRNDSGFDRLREEPLVPTTIPSVATFTLAGVTSPYDPAQRPTQAAAFWLGRDIARGVFAPLERLKIEQLTQFYSIGHSPIREAILLLSSSGLVIHEHQKGHRVAPVSLADYDDLLNVYMRIYRLALGMAMEFGTDEWEERVVLTLYRSQKVKKVLLDGDPQARELWQRTYGEFHRSLLAGCGSALLLQIYNDLGTRLERYVNLFGDLESDRERDHHAEHREIVDAVIARDKELVRTLIDRYFTTAKPIRDSIVASLKRKERTDTAATSGRKRGDPS